MAEQRAKTRSELLSREIEKAIREDKFRGKGFLPSVRFLAQQFSASQKTVVDALKIVALRGKIFKIPNKKQWFITKQAYRSTAVTEPDLHHEIRYEMVARKIRKEIAAGIFNPEAPLPTARELQLRYHCGWTTVKKALVQLVEQEVIHRQNRRWHVGPEPIFSPPGSQVYMVNTEALFGQVRFGVFSILRAIQRALSYYRWPAMNMSFVKADFSPAQDQANIPIHKIAGLLHIAVEWNPNIMDFLRKHSEIPVAIIQADEPVLFEAPLNTKSISILPDNYVAGTRVGSHLLSLGHRKIAFFAPRVLSMTQWSLRRAEGLRDELGDNGGFLKEFYGSVGQGETDSPTSHPIDFGAFTKVFPRGVVRTVTEDTHRYAEDIIRCLELIPLFEKVAQNKEITAWVCCNDIVAAAAQKFLQDQRIKTPQEITLVGFDNSPISMALNITSYDPMLDNMGRAAITHLVRPKYPRKSSLRLLRMPGELIIRNSLH